jgi:membrane protease YdiL (CAAX protease family)
VGWIGVAIGGVVLSVAIGFACFLPAVRQRAAEFIDIDPFSFVHATALATTVGIGLMFMVPLLVVQEPPILSLLRWDKFPDLPADENLRTTVYTLFWSVPASFIAVGYPQKRAFREARERLGLLWPGWLQLLGVVIAIAVLLVTMTYLELGVNWLWTRLGWSVTDADAISELFSFGAGPVAAVLVGFAAGLGEELVFRGVLQPRLGIVLPALMFTSVHAFQYNFDALIQVLLLGLAFGLIRKRTNTTTCVLIHAGYDCVLFFWLYLYGSVGTQ